jgi:hypothetical protein
MRFRCALAAALLVPFLLGRASAAAPVAQPVHTNKSRFRIPFKYDPAEMQKLGAREIRLYLSADRGLTWRLGQTVDPRERKFDFVAPGDGEYWFAVRTLDGRGQLHPAGAGLDAGLKVVVDTTPPALEVKLRQVEPGKVELTWTAADPNLNVTTLRLEYMQAGGTNWQQVSIIPQASGRTAWSAPQGGFVAVRGTVGDLAQNTQHAQSQTKVEAAAQQPAKPSVPDLRQPIAVDGPDELAARFPQPFAKPPVEGTASTPPTLSIGPPAFQPVYDRPRNRPDILQGRYPKNDEPQASDALPRRIVNSRAFQIGYRVDDVGPSGVAGVDLYVTEDNGRKWYKYGSDPDSATPFPVEVPGEGAFGFALRVRSGAGLGAEPPASGEAPSLMVIVDETPPKLEITAARQVSGPNRLRVDWRMIEANPAPQPIGVYAATAQEGPWQPVAEALENSGQYEWAIGPQTPSRLFLRLTARDVAGNTATADTQEPVVLDSSRPTARIVDVESLEPRQ